MIKKKFTFIQLLSKWMFVKRVKNSLLRYKYFSNLLTLMSILSLHKMSNNRWWDTKRTLKIYTNILKIWKIWFNIKFAPKLLNTLTSSESLKNSALLSTLYMLDSHMRTLIINQTLSMQSVVNKTKNVTI